MKWKIDQGCNREDKKWDPFEFIFTRVAVKNNTLYKALFKKNVHSSLKWSNINIFFDFYLTEIEEANWLTLPEDLGDLLQDGFDAVICLGNSFAHMMDDTGDQADQK